MERLTERLNNLKKGVSQMGDKEEIKANKNFLKYVCEYLEQLKSYKDAEEQGLLLRLPCKIGDIAYSITRNFISEYTICSIEKYKEGFFFNWRCEKGIYINARGFTNYDIGKTVFLTREAAEQALKDMEKGV